MFVAHEAGVQGQPVALPARPCHNRRCVVCGAQQTWQSTCPAMILCAVGGAVGSAGGRCGVLIAGRARGGALH